MASGRCWLVHARRKFVEVAKAFPEQVRHLLESLRQVHPFEAVSEEQGMSPGERLRSHQENCRPVMEDLHAWLKEQIDSKKTAPNSGLGKAIRHMLKPRERPRSRGAGSKRGQSRPSCA